MSESNVPGTAPLESAPAAPNDKPTAEEILSATTAPTESPATTPPELKPETNPENDKYAAKFAALARREKAIKAQEKALQARISELEAKLQNPAAPAPEPEEPLELRIKRNPFETLAKMGLSYEKLTEMALNNGNLAPEIKEDLLKHEITAKFSKELEAVKARLEAKEKQEEEARKAAEERQYAQQIEQFKGSIKETITAKKDTYELLEAEGDDGIELVYEVIAQDAQKKTAEAAELGEEWDASNMLSIEEAAQKVEDHFLEIAKKRIGLKKVAGLFQPPTPPTQATPPQASKPASPTLSNVTQQAQGQKRAFLSDEESKREAAKLLRWNS